VTKRLIPSFVVVFFLSACATEWGSKMRTGSETYAAVPAERVDILFGGSPRPYKQIGIVSVLGGAFSSDVAMLAKLRKSRSRSGSRRGDCYRAISRTNDGARITDHPRFGDHHRNDHANGLRSLRKCGHTIYGNYRWHARYGVFLSEESGDSYQIP